MIILTKEQVAPLLAVKNFSIENIQVSDFEESHIPHFYKAFITTDLHGKETAPRAVLFIMRESSSLPPLIRMKDAHHMGDVLARFDISLLLDAAEIHKTPAQKTLTKTKFKGAPWSFTF